MAKENTLNEKSENYESKSDNTITLNMQIGQRVGDLRERFALSKKDLGDFLGLSPSAYFAKENGINASFTTTELQKIAHKFKITLDALYCEYSIDEGLSFAKKKDCVNELEQTRLKLEKALEVVTHLQSVISVIKIHF